MNRLFDSFWRAAAYCLMPRIIALSLLPLLLISLAAAAGWYVFWDSAVAWLQAALEQASWLGVLWQWLGRWGMEHVPDTLAPLLLIAGTLPVIVLVCVLSVALLMTPAVVDLVAQRRFPMLQRKHGGSFAASLAWSLGSTLAALLALVLSMPLWLIPPLVLVLPPLIWGWLTYRVMAFDALAEHASRAERQDIYKRHYVRLLLMGVLCGFAGAAPAIVWASGVVFVAAFFVLVPLAIWIYTLVFAFSCLWFTHYCLDALQQLRAQQGDGAGAPQAPPDAGGLPPA
jgi:hypothetical protein